MSWGKGRLGEGAGISWLTQCRFPRTLPTAPLQRALCQPHLHSVPPWLLHG